VFLKDHFVFVLKMSYLERDSKSDFASSLTRCGKKILAFSINNILSGENNNNVNNRERESSKRSSQKDQEQDQSDDEVNNLRFILMN
jgi:hypothetical protein